MDLPTDKTRPLTSIRTLARDLANQRSAKSKPAGPADAKTDEPKAVSVPKSEPANPAPVRNIYQAPQWKKNPAKETAPAESPVVSVLDTPTVNKQPPASLGSEDNEIVLGNNSDSDATIIRDTKRNRFRLFPAVLTSINNWLEDFKAKQKERRKPKYAVPDSTLRKGVIQKATSKTGKVASFDSSRIQDKIRERDAISKPRRFFTFWTPNTEPGLPLLDAPDETNSVVIEEPVTKPVNVQVEPKRSVYTKLPTSDEVLTLPAVTNVAKPDPAPTPSLDPITIPPRPPVPVIKPATSTSRISLTEPKVAQVPKPFPPAPVTLVKTVPPVEKSFDQTETIESPAPKVNPPAQPELPPKPIIKTEPPLPTVPPLTKTTAPKSWRSQLLNHNTNRLATGIFTMTIVLATLGTGVFVLINDSREVGIPVTASPEGILNGPIQTLDITATDQSREGLLTSLNLNISESGYPIQQIVFTSRVDPQTGPTPLSPGSILDLLNINLNSSFVLTISELQFGAVNQRPFITMSGSDYTVLRGGMLAWENTLYDDLVDILNLPSYTRAQFRDVLIEGRDARVLRDSQNGNELFVYGIVDKRIIIIAQNRVDFITLANNLKPF